METVPGREGGCATPINSTLWLKTDETPIDELLASVNWPRETMCAHNAQFDAAILAFHYGIVPEFILDTLCIARAIFGLTENVGLADLSKRYGLPDKSGPYDEIDGKRFEDMPPELVERLRIGCERDVLNLREIFKRHPSWC